MTRGIPDAPRSQLRGPARLATGLAALAAVAFVLVGWPWLLVSAATGPLADYLPDISAPALVLAHPDAAGLFLALALLAAGLAWAMTAAALVVELAAQARGRRAPSLGAVFPQITMSRLAGSVLLIVPATGLLPTGPATALTATQPPPAAATADVHAVSAPAGTEADCDDASPKHARSHPYTVRRGDTLWSVSARELGSGRRFPRVFRASTGTRQPDGRHLVDPDLILPGWRLTIPETNPVADPQPCRDSTAHPSADATPGPTHASPPAAGRSSQQAIPDLDRAARPGLAASGRIAAGAGPTGPAQGRIPAAGPQAPQPPRGAGEAEPEGVEPLGAPASSLLPIPELDRAAPLASAVPSSGPPDTQSPRPPAPTPPPSAAPLQVRGLVVESLTATEAILRWEPVAAAVQYWVIVDGQSSRSPGAAVALRGLRPGTSHQVEVRALDPQGVWGPQATLTFRSPTAEPARWGAPSPTAATAGAAPAALAALRPAHLSEEALAARIAEVVAVSPAGHGARGCLLAMERALGMVDQPPRVGSHHARTARGLAALSDRSPDRPAAGDLAPRLAALRWGGPSPTSHILATVPPPWRTRGAAIHSMITSGVS